MDTKSENKYIEKRRRKAKLLSLLFRIMRVFPIRKNKIVFACFEGDGGYGCNPKYIAEEILHRKLDLELIWLTHDVNREFPEEIKVVKDDMLHTAFHLSTAKVWIDNYRKPYGTLKRKGQFYIQTWHASIGFKAVGLYRGDKFPKIARLVSEWDSNLADYVISNSDYCDEVYPKKLLYTGPTLRVGSPRLDPLINKTEKERKAVCDKLGIDAKDFVVLYAPTFRGGIQSGKKQVESKSLTLNLELLRTSLKDKYHRNVIVLLRLHPQLAVNQSMGYLEKEGIVDVTKYPDISEVMVGCDMVITDYSSCAFDAAFAGIPVLLYADDIKEYTSKRGEFMWKREELPFDIAEDNDELMGLVEKFDNNIYMDRVKLFMDSHGVVEDGHASERVVDAIVEMMK